MNAGEEELALLRNQIRAYRERLTAIEARIGVGEARMDEHDARLEQHEGAIVDATTARILFASVVEDMQRELTKLRNEVADSD